MQPYTSLANILLSAETRQNPLVKSWFDRFRIVTDDDDDVAADVIQQEAITMNCRILYGNCCYSENGAAHDLSHEVLKDAVTTLLQNWKECVSVRRTKIMQQCRKYVLEKRMDAQAKTMSDLEAEQSETRFQIR